MPPRRPKLVPARRKPPIHPFDLTHGTDTGGLIPASSLQTGQTSDPHITAYYGVAPSILRSLIDLWLQNTAPPYAIERYTFLDVGAGKGRAILLAAECPFFKVIGVELNPDLAAIAQQNVAVLTRGPNPQDGNPGLLSPIEVVHSDILRFPLPPGPTLAFLFHPFESPLLKQFIRRIETQLAKRSGELDLMYVNAEHAPVLDNNPAFRTLWRGAVPMSTEDHLADLDEIAEQEEYGSTGDEQCRIYRYVGRAPVST